MKDNLNQENIDRISNIKRKVNEIGLTPLEEHGARFEEVNRDLTDALASVEGLSNQQ